MATAGGSESWYIRPEARRWECAAPDPAASAFHAGLPGYRPTRLIELPALAEELRVSRVFVKDESARMGLPAFKVLGASWGVARALAVASAPATVGDAAVGDAAVGDAGAGDAAGGLTVAALRRAAAARPLELVTATEGNHGRAVAWMGRLLGLKVRVFMPRVVPAEASAAIAGEGATVTAVDGPYDRAVELAADYAAAGQGRALVQDMGWPGYERVPGWIVEGYGTLLREVDAQLAERGVPGPGLVSVPVGVGSLAQAVVAHYRSRPARRGGSPPAVLSVEPDTAACLLASLLDGATRSVPTADSVMAGLNCGTPSSLAWPVLAAGLDAAIAVPDGAAIRAAADLARLGVQAGPCGAASLAGVRSALTAPDAGDRRDGLAVTPSSVLVLLSTEGRSTAATA
jgi:diaminopropionate ammonia-lyase